MIYSDELLAVAKRIFWFGTPEEALEFPQRFLTYAMTYASDEDIEIARKYFTDDDFRATLDDPRTWDFRPKIMGQMELTLQPHSRPASSEATDSRRRSNHPRFLSPPVLKTSARFTECSCHSSPQFHAPTFSHSVYPANENQACLLLGVLDSQTGPALQ